MSSTHSHERPATHTPVALIVFAWLLVGLPLLYGLYFTIIRASALFGG